MTDHPRDGSRYPFIDRVEVMDCGLKLGILVREEDGTLSALRVNVADILDRADVRMTSNVR